MAIATTIYGHCHNYALHYLVFYHYFDQCRRLSYPTDRYLIFLEQVGISIKASFFLSDEDSLVGRYINFCIAKARSRVILHYTRFGNTAC